MIIVHVSCLAGLLLGARHKATMLGDDTISGMVQVSLMLAVSPGHQKGGTHDCTPWSASMHSQDHRQMS